MNSLRSHRSKIIMAAVNMNNYSDEAAEHSTETNECFPTHECSLEPNAPSTSYAHVNLATDIDNLITMSDLDDSVEDPNFLLSEENESDKDTSMSESCEPTALRDYVLASSLNLPPNNQFKANFVAAYPGPLYIYDENLPDSEISVIAPPPSLQTSQQKRKAKHPMIENCCDNSKCKRQCAMFSLESRKTIWEEYWNLSFLSRRSFLNKCIQISKIKRRKVEVSNETFFKNESRFFFLPNSDGILISVCKKFFLATLGHKTDGVITELSKAVKKGKLYGSVTKDKRSGRKKIDGSIIINHIMSFHPTVSHYRRHNAPFTKYLPRHLTLRQMYTDFKQQNPNFTCGRELYRQKIKELKISFHMPKGDKCVDCALYEEELKKYDDVTLMPEEMKQKSEDHKAKVESSIQKYRLDGNNKNSNLVKFVSMDLQKVIIPEIPEMPDIKDAFFMSRLITFNLTFAPIEKKSDDSSTCVLWHEAIAGREASDIVNAIYAFIESNRDMQHLHLWADNCTAQNKNWTLYSAMTMIVNNPSNSLESVTINYLTKGHTHMSADAVHGNIEMKMKRQKNVYDFQDFKDIVMNSRKNIKVIEVTNKFEWPKKKRAARQNEPLKEFNLNSVVQVKMIAGSRNLFYRTSFSEPGPGLVELDFLMKKFNCQLPPASNDSPRGIKHEKKHEIITKLVNLMPESRKTFWYNLPVNDLSADLTSHGQLDSY